MNDPKRTISFNQYERLKLSFVNQYLKDSQIKHGTIQDDICAAGLTSPSRQWFHDFLASQTYCFRISKLDFLCQLLFGSSFAQWEALNSEHELPTTDSKQGLSPVGFVGNKRSHVHTTSPFTSGLIAIHESRPPGSLLEYLLTVARKEIWVCNYSLSHSLAIEQGRILDAVNRGVVIRLLFYSPLSQSLSFGAESIGLTPDIVKLTCTTTVSMVIKLMRHIQGHQRSSAETSVLKVRMTDIFPRMGCYLCDPDDEGTSFFVPSINRKMMLHLPVYEFSNLPNGVSQRYVEGLREEWNSATPFEDFLCSHSSCIPEGLLLQSMAPLNGSDGLESAL